jgi:hypothetical protein
VVGIRVSAIRFAVTPGCVPVKPNEWSTEMHRVGVKHRANGLVLQRMRYTKESRFDFLYLNRPFSIHSYGY